MTFTSRISLCIFSIYVTFPGAAYGNESQVILDTLPKSLTELLPSTFVQIEIQEPAATTELLFQAVIGMTKIISTTYYSLLNWKVMQRTQSVHIESYNRLHHFGHWVNDVSDETCFNTRAKVLIRDSVKTVVFDPDNLCTVQSGQWDDPYARKVLKDAKAEVQIDHMVPLKNAYVSGAHNWTFKTRCLYGNYLGASFHLISVDGTENMKKGSDGPEEYLPPNATYRCTYLKNWLAIKAFWGLTMTPAEAAAITTAIRVESCQPNLFRLTSAEIKRQHEFAATNAELCANVTPDLQQ